MTRSSIAAAVVVTLLLGLLIWWRDEHSHIERTTEALTPPSNANLRGTGEVRAVPAARSVSPSRGAPFGSSGEGMSTIPFEGAGDAGVSTSR